MANDLKHVGRVSSNGRKCLVAFRTLPGDAFNCLVVQTELLNPSDHDAIISLVESNAAQTAFEFGEVLGRSYFPDGSPMLASLHVKGLLGKFATDQIEMMPNMHSTIMLSELNQLIAEQTGVSVQDLAIKATVKENSDVQELAQVREVPPSTPEVFDDAVKTTSASVNQEPKPVPTFESADAEAKYYRSQADALSKQAAEMRRKAEDLVPTKKKVKAEA